MEEAMEPGVLRRIKNTSSLTARTLWILGSPLVLLALEQHPHQDNRDPPSHTFTSTISAIHNASRFKIGPRKWLQLRVSADASSVTFWRRDSESLFLTSTKMGSSTLPLSTSKPTPRISDTPYAICGMWLRSIKQSTKQQISLE